MKNGVFVVWMLLYPLVCSITGYLVYLRGERFDETVQGLSALAYLAIWVYVGTKLYEGKQKS